MKIFLLESFFFYHRTIMKYGLSVVLLNELSNLIHLKNEAIYEKIYYLYFTFVYTIIYCIMSIHKYSH